MPGSGICAGWWRASGWLGEKTAQRGQCRRLGSCVAAYRRKCVSWPTSRCCRAPTSGSTSTGCTRRLREVSAGRDRARRKTCAIPDQRPCAAAVHRRARRAAVIVDEPPLITSDAEAAHRVALDEYLATLAPHWRRVLGGYTLVDIAHKVVGVGSVGLRAYVALLEGSSPDDVVFLQLKQARRSVLARYVHGDSAWHAHQGQRVVEYQQALQTVSDPLLGWTTIGTAVLRPPVPQHEGHDRAGCHRRGGTDRLRRDRRPPAGQGPRPNQRCFHDRRICRRSTSWTALCRFAGHTRTRPRPTMPAWWRRCGRVGCPSSTARWSGRFGLPAG